MTIIEMTPAYLAQKEAAAFRRGAEARDRQIVKALTITPSLRAGCEDSPWLKGLDAAREIIAALPLPEDKP